MVERVNQASFPGQLLELVELVGEVVWTATTGERRLLYTSPATEQVYGRPAADFYENPNLWYEVIHPDDRHLVEQTYSTLLAEGRSEVTYRITRPDGETRWLLDRAYLLVDDTGTPYQFGGITADITTQKQTEERLRQVLENSVDVSYKRNLQTNTYDYVSSVMVRISGYTAEEMQSWPISKTIEMIHPADRPAVERAIAAALDAPAATAFQLEYRFRHKEGQYLWFHDQFKVMRDGHGQPAALIGSIGNITRRKQSEALVQAQRDLSRIISLNTAPGEAWAQCVEIVLRVSGLDSGGIYLLDEDHVGLELVYHYGLGAEFVRQAGSFLADSRSARLVMAGESLYLTAADFAHLPSHVVEGLHCAAMLPIRYQQQVLGSINVASHTLPAIPEFSRRALETLAPEIGNIVIYLRAGASLRKSEDRFRNLFDTTVQGVVYQDAEGRIISANPAAKQILGLSLNQLQGRTSIDPRCRAIQEDGTEFPGEAHPAMVALRTGQPVRNVLMGVFHPGTDSYVWININAMPQFKPGQSRPYQVYATFEDITERKISQDILSARLRLVEFAATASIRELLQATLDELGALVGSPIGFYHFVEADQRTLSLQAWSTRTRAEFCTASDEASHYPVDQAGVWADCIRERRPIIHNDYPALEHRRGLPHGHAEVRREAITPVIRGDRLMAIVGVGNKPTNYTHADLEIITMLADLSWDIVERKQAEVSLRESQMRLELALKGAQMGTWDWYVQTGQTVFNERWAEIIGYTLAELEPVTIQTWIDFCHPDDLRKSNTLLERHWAGHSEFYECEVRMKHKNGSWVWVVNRGQVVEWDAVGRPTRMTGTHLDINDRKRAEHELLELNHTLEARVQKRTAELVRASRAKDEFLANMSHELRTPLNAILNFSEILQEAIYGPLNEQQASAIDSIESSGRHLLSLINDILDLSKVEAGQLDFQMRYVSVAEICRASLLLVKEMALRKSLKLGFQLNDHMAEMETDPKRLKQMLVNLLSNAVKFTPDGGRVSLHVEADGEAGVIAFAVQDNGIGIAPEDMGELFLPFQQVDSSLSRQFEGSGLGLALVRRLAELHGGSIAVESQPGEGSLFTLSLPYQSPANLHADGAVSGASLPRSALVIEDTDNSADQITRYLRELNLHTEVYTRAAGALDRAAAMQPELIVLDLLLPDRSGWEVLARLRADSRTRDIPVMIVSVLDERSKGLAAGAVEYLVKPISRDMLRQGLMGLAAGARAGQVRPPAKAPEFVHTTGPGILLVEDSETNIEVLNSYLTANGFRVNVARDGHEALARAEDVSPDLILMDIQMPRMDGLEAIRRLRADDRFRQTPIIALTALAMPGDRERCLEAGANEYLPKPASLKGLVGLIDRLLAARHPRRGPMP